MLTFLSIEIYLHTNCKNEDVIDFDDKLDIIKYKLCELFLQINK